MFSFRPQPITAGLPTIEPYDRARQDSAGWIVAKSPPQYRPRHPERSALYHLFETHFDSYVRAYEERFEPRSGPLRPVVVRSVQEFLSCGRLEGGFARIRCTKCRKEHLLAFSCRTRNFCSSCQAKRSVLFAEKLAGEILAPVPHRHWTFSIPRASRRIGENSALIRRRQQMSGCPTGRLSSRSASDRRRNHRRCTRKTGLAGMGQNSISPMQPFPRFNPCQACFPPSFPLFPY
jgi:hypothetical protein